MPNDEFVFSSPMLRDVVEGLNPNARPALEPAGAEGLRDSLRDSLAQQVYQRLWDSYCPEPYRPKFPRGPLPLPRPPLPFPWPPGPPPPPEPLWLAELLAEAVVNQVRVLQELGQTLGDESAEKVQAYSDGLLAEFVHDCGTGLMEQKLREFLQRLRKRWPWPEPVPPRPEENLLGSGELLVISNVLLNSAAVSKTLGFAGQDVQQIVVEQLKTPGA